MFGVLIRTLVLALALFPPLASAQSVLQAFPPGTFQSRAAFDGASSGHPMVTPILWDNGGIAPSNTALNYTGLPGGTFSATQTARQAVVAINGTVSGLQVRFPTAAGSGATWNICLVKNGSSSCTALACQVTNSALTCNDTTDTVSVSAGDLLGWQICPSNASGCPAGSAPAAQTGPVQIAAVITSSANGESALFSTVGSSAASASAQNFASWGSNVSWNATEATVSAVMPTAGTIDHLNFSTNTAPGAAKSIQLQVYHNGSASTVTCTITGTGSGAGITTCSDLTDSFTVAAGDTISLSSTPTGTPSIGTATASVRFVPTIPGEAVALNVNGAALSTSNPRFGPVGGSALSGTEVTISVVPSAFTVKKFYATVDVAPGGSATRVNVLRNGTGSGQSNAGTPSAVGCTLTTTTQCSDLTDTFLTTIGNLIDWSETPNSSPASAAVLKFSAVLYTP